MIILLRSYRSNYRIKEKKFDKVINLQDEKFFSKIKKLYFFFVKFQKDWFLQK